MVSVKNPIAWRICHFSLVAALGVLIGCGESEAPSEEGAGKTKGKALVVVVETIQLSSRFEMVYLVNPEPIAEFFSNVVGIPIEEVRSVPSHAVAA